MKKHFLPPSLFCLCVLLMVLSAHWFPSLTILRFPFTLCGVAFLSPGLGLALASSSAFARSGNPFNPFSQPDTLLTQGAFRYTRNPIYLGLLLSLIGLGLLLGTALSFVGAAVFFAASEFCYIPCEEAALAARFGEAYLEYKQRVRRWI